MAEAHSAYLRTAEAGFAALRSLWMMEMAGEHAVSVETTRCESRRCIPSEDVDSEDVDSAEKDGSSRVSVGTDVAPAPESTPPVAPLRTMEPASTPPTVVPAATKSEPVSPMTASASAGLDTTSTRC